MNVSIGRMSALGANRTRRDGGNGVNDMRCVRTPQRNRSGAILAMVIVPPALAKAKAKRAQSAP
jgi:hypothetical protein